jgi:hypothetical protein
MEGIKDAESFESFKKRITEIFGKEGLSENLILEINIWHDKRHKETDGMGGSIEERVVFQMELAEIYIATDQQELAFDTLSDAGIQADQEGLNDLSAEIDELMNSLNG